MISWATCVDNVPASFSLRAGKCLLNVLEALKVNVTRVYCGFNDGDTWQPVAGLLCSALWCCAQASPFVSVREPAGMRHLLWAQQTVLRVRVGEEGESGGLLTLWCETAGQQTIKVSTRRGKTLCLVSAELLIDVCWPGFKLKLFSPPRMNVKIMRLGCIMGTIFEPTQWCVGRNGAPNCSQPCSKPIKWG